VAVATNAKYKTVADLIADAKAAPGRLNYGSWSVGNPVHLGSALFETATGTDMVHVIYKETTQLYTAVANGELAFALGTSATAGALQRAGKLRFLAVAAPNRIPAFKDVPTVAESGGPRNFEVTGWTALAAPRGTPRAITDKIARDVEAALAEPDIREKYVAFAYEPFPLTRDEFTKMAAAESARFAEIIKRVGASLD
jgi:tripartite-type tricarboxylate transporter receptor subunit TctC